MTFLSPGMRSIILSHINDFYQRWVTRPYKYRGILLGNPLRTFKIIRGLKALRLGQLGISEKIFRSIGGDCATDYRICIGLAKIAMQQDRLDDSLLFWELAVAQLPPLLRDHMEDLDPAIGKLNCLLSMYRFADCKNLAQELAATRASDLRPHVILARIDMKEGYFEQAQKKWIELAKRFPGNIHSFIGQANCFLEKSRLEQTETFLDTAGPKWANSLEFGILRARLAYRRDELELAKNILEPLINKYPEEIRLYNLLWRSMQSMGEAGNFSEIIGQSPGYITNSEQFILEVLVPYYVENLDARALKTYADQSLHVASSPAQIEIRARYLLFSSQFLGLIGYLEPGIKEFPYRLEYYQLLMQGYYFTNRFDDLMHLKKDMIRIFGEHTTYPLLLNMGPRFIRQDFPDFLDWLIRHPEAQQNHLSDLLDWLIVNGTEKEISASLSRLGELPSADISVRSHGIECQRRDISTLLQSVSRPVNWSAIESHRDKFREYSEQGLSSLFHDQNDLTEMRAFYQTYKQATREYQAAFLDSRESYYEAAAVSDIIARRIRDATPTSLIRLGDGEGNFLRYRADLQKYASLDQKAIQNLWWKQAFIDSEDAKNIRIQLMSTIANADLVGVPPAWRVVSEFFRHGKIRLNGRHNRGNLAIIDLISSRNISRDKILISSAIANDLICWNLYKPLLALVQSVSYISCHDLAPLLSKKFGVSSRQKLTMPAEFAYRQMFDSSLQKDSGRVAQPPDSANVYPELFQRISGSIAPQPGELYLVAAGFLGKFFCNTIKRGGGIGLDIGSAADYWMGYETRRFNQNEIDFDLLSSSITGMPLKDYVLQNTK